MWSVVRRTGFGIHANNNPEKTNKFWHELIIPQGCGLVGLLVVKSNAPAERRPTGEHAKNSSKSLRCGPSAPVDYRYSVLLSVILSTPGRSLSGKAGTCTRRQGLPHHRLPLMPAQHVSSPVPGRHSNTRGEMTHDTAITRHLCSFSWARLG